MTVQMYDDYLAERTGCYEYREIRYTAAGAAMAMHGLSDSDSIYDIGAGFTELDYCLRTRFNWRGRYIPVDGAIDDTDLNYWTPKRDVQFSVALELLEHLNDPLELVWNLQKHTSKAIVVSVPNPRTVDVLGIDRTHVTVVTREMLESWGFFVVERTFYGGAFSNGQPDSLFGVWEA
jgi:hypothetical protein